MKVSTPLGAYPFEFRRIERRKEGLAIVGLVAGMESSVILEPADFRATGRLLGPPLAALALALALRRRRRR